MGKTLGTTNEDSINKTISIEAFKKVYQKNRDQMKPLKITFDKKRLK